MKYKADAATLSGSLTNDRFAGEQEDVHKVLIILIMKCFSSALKPWFCDNQAMQSYQQLFLMFSHLF